MPKTKIHNSIFKFKDTRQKTIIISFRLKMITLSFKLKLITLSFLRESDHIIFWRDELEHVTVTEKRLILCTYVNRDVVKKISSDDAYFSSKVRNVNYCNRLFTPDPILPNSFSDSHLFSFGICNQ